MKFFFDTSAFVKFFRDEKGTKVVTDLILSKNNDVYILELAKLEFYSSIYRLLRYNEISENEKNLIIENFNNELKKFNIEPLTNSIINEGKSIIETVGKKYRIRTLDALHLAAYCLISDEGGIL